MTFVEIAMLLYCASFRWPLIVMGQLHEKREKEKEKLGGKIDRCIDTTGNSGNSVNQSKRENGKKKIEIGGKNR
jgi:hypothetical protein